MRVIEGESRQQQKFEKFFTVFGYIFEQTFLKNSLDTRGTFFVDNYIVERKRTFLE